MTIEECHEFKTRILQFRTAYDKLNDIWATDPTLGSTDYPFYLSFDELNVFEWTRTFLAELDFIETKLTE